MSRMMKILRRRRGFLMVFIIANAVTSAKCQHNDNEIAFNCNAILVVSRLNKDARKTVKKYRTKNHNHKLHLPTDRDDVAKELCKQSQRLEYYIAAHNQFSSAKKYSENIEKEMLSKKKENTFSKFISTMPKLNAELQKLVSHVNCPIPRATIDQLIVKAKIRLRDIYVKSAQTTKDISKLLKRGNHLLRCERRSVRHLRKKARRSRMRGRKKGKSSRKERRGKKVSRKQRRRRHRKLSCVRRGHKKKFINLQY